MRPEASIVRQYERLRAIDMHRDNTRIAPWRHGEQLLDGIAAGPQLDLYARKLSIS